MSMLSKVKKVPAYSLHEESTDLNSGLVDHSILKPSVAVGDSSPYGVIKMIKSGTQEIHDLLCECEVIFECKVCKNLFRSIANFISHKRFYCQCKYHEVAFNSDNADTVVYDVGNNSSENNSNMTETKRKIDFVLKKLNNTVENQLMKLENVEPKTQSTLNVYLEGISQNKNAMYQTVNQQIQSKKPVLISSKLAEVRRNKMFKDSVVVGADGKIKGLQSTQNSTDVKSSAVNGDGLKKKETEDIYSHICVHCNTYFSSAKTLRYHMRTHQSMPTVYRCPVCHGAFTNLGILFKHLGTVHNKSESQIKRLKQDITTFSNSSVQKVSHTVISANTLRCTDCSKKFTNKDNLFKHLKRCATKSKSNLKLSSSQADKSSKPVSKTSQSDIKRVKNDSPVPSKLPELPTSKPIRIEIRQDYSKDFKNVDNNVAELSKSRKSRKSAVPKKRGHVLDNPDSPDAHDKDFSSPKVVKLAPEARTYSNYDSRTCRKCMKRCKSFTLLKSHYKTHFKGNGSYKCSFCGYISTQHLCTQHVFKLHYGSEEKWFTEAEEKVFPVHKGTEVRASAVPPDDTQEEVFEAQNTQPDCFPINSSNSSESYKSYQNSPQSPECKHRKLSTTYLDDPNYCDPASSELKSETHETEQYQLGKPEQPVNLSEHKPQSNNLPGESSDSEDIYDKTRVKVEMHDKDDIVPNHASIIPLEEDDEEEDKEDKPDALRQKDSLSNCGSEDIGVDPLLTGLNLSAFSNDTRAPQCRDVNSVTNDISIIDLGTCEDEEDAESDALFKANDVHFFKESILHHVSSTGQLTPCTGATAQCMSKPCNGLLPMGTQAINSQL